MKFFRNKREELEDIEDVSIDLENGESMTIGSMAKVVLNQMEEKEMMENEKESKVYDDYKVKIGNECMTVKELKNRYTKMMNEAKDKKDSEEEAEKEKKKKENEEMMEKEKMEKEKKEDEMKKEEAVKNKSTFDNLQRDIQNGSSEKESEEEYKILEDRISLGKTLF